MKNTDFIKKINSGKIRRLSVTAGLLLFTACMLSGCAMGGATGSATVKGDEALEAGEYENAKACFEEAVQNNEDQLLANRGLGIACIGLAEYEDAVEAFKTAISYADEKQPENIKDIKLYMATAYYRMGSYDEVISTCNEILDENEDVGADTYFLRGAAYLYEGQQSEAGSDFSAAAALSPEDYDLYLNIYECYNDMNLSGLGSQYLQDALNISGDDMEYYYNQGRVYYYLENYEEAQKMLISPVENGYEPAMYLIGRVYMALGDEDHAMAVYQQLLDEKGEDAQALNGLALCALEDEDYNAALDYIARGIAVGEGDALRQLYFNEIIVYERMEDYAAARDKAEIYVQTYPTDESGQKEYTFLSTRS